MRTSLSWFLVALAFLFSGTARAQCMVDSLTPTILGFGASVEVNGDWAFVGAPSVSSSNPPPRVEVYRRTGGDWIPVQTLMTPILGSSFGRQLVSDGEWLFVWGRENSATGSELFVYRLVGGTWSPTQTIPAPAAGTPLHDLALEGGVAVVGWRTGTVGFGYGDTVLVFEESGGTWLETAQLPPFGAGDPRGFGATVAVTDGWIGVGTPFHSEPGGPIRTGGVYLYERGAATWAGHSVLVPVDAGESDAYGTSIAASAGRIAFGAQTFAGRVQVYARSGGAWIREDALAPDADAYFPYFGLGGFGYALDLDGGRLVATAPEFFGISSRTGAGFVFERGAAGWQQRGRFFNENGVGNEFFGESIALSGDAIFATLNSAFDDVIVHDVSMGANFRYCVAAPNSDFPEGAQMEWEGSLSVGTNDFTVRVSRTPFSQFGLFLYGTSPTQTPLADGFLCVGGSIVRLGAPVLMNGLAPTRLDLDLTALQTNSGTVTVTPGTTLFFQTWFRDTPAVGSGANLSNGLSVQFCP
ncbi:MAG: hypothetical protein AAFP86_14575 [Planctomycetota bacterium]